MAAEGSEGATTERGEDEELVCPPCDDCLQDREGYDQAFLPKLVPLKWKHYHPDGRRKGKKCYGCWDTKR